MCNILVPKEVKRLTTKRLNTAKGSLRGDLKKGWDTTISETRVKAYERLQKSLNSTPGDLNCNADYSVEVIQLSDIFIYESR